ncbi:MAG: SRPBCC domain-containing protein, partial [Nitrososphaera sp.]
TKAEPEKELRWVGKVPGIVSGEHTLTIEQLDGNRVRLANNEIFGGLLSSFFGGSIEDIKAGFEQMNQALKKRAEG